MKHPSIHKRTKHGIGYGAKRGMTLIEAVIYVGLFGTLMSALMPYIISIHEQDMRLLDNITAALQA